MKTRIIAAVALLCIALGSQAQKHEFANWNRYANANKELGAPAKGEKRVVLMGNSITDGWPRTRPEFFKDNNLIGRGIGGQTSYQFLLRFREDVINLQPKVVVIRQCAFDGGVGSLSQVQGYPHQLPSCRRFQLASFCYRQHGEDSQPQCSRQGLR